MWDFVGILFDLLRCACPSGSRSVVSTSWFSRSDSIGAGDGDVGLGQIGSNWVVGRFLVGFFVMCCEMDYLCTKM